MFDWSENDAVYLQRISIAYSQKGFLYTESTHRDPRKRFLYAESTHLTLRKRFLYAESSYREPGEWFLCTESSYREPGEYILFADTNIKLQTASFNKDLTRKIFTEKGGLHYNPIQR